MMLRDLHEAWLKRRTLRRWLAVPDVARRVDEVLALDATGFGSAAERSLPGDPEFVASGWSQHMLLRYLLALEVAEGRVLDTCCGLGWGSHLLATAADVTGVDVSADAIEFCRRRWTEPAFVVGSVLELPFEDETFDVVLCMEAIEHFSRADGRRYLQELRRVTRPGGTLVGSSTFPARRADAERLCATNEHHLHIYTRAEMKKLLQTSFGDPSRLTRHYFLARKPSAPHEGRS